jgi:hypothetical protein
VFTEPIVEIGRKSYFEPAWIVLRLKLNDVEDSILRKDESIGLQSLILAVQNGIWQTQFHPDSLCVLLGNMKDHLAPAVRGGHLLSLDFEPVDYLEDGLFPSAQLGR